MPSTGVDDEVGRPAPSVAGDDAGDVRDAVGDALGGRQTDHRLAPANLDAGLPLGGPAGRGLQHRAPTRDRGEPLVAVAPATGDGLRQDGHAVLAQQTIGDERIGDVRHLVVEYLPEPREERVRWRNWVTSRRSHVFQASAGAGGGGGSRSSTVTWWPSLASSMAAAPAIWVRSVSILRRRRAQFDD